MDDLNHWRISARPKHGRSGRFDKMWGFQHRKTFCQFSLNCPFPHALWITVVRKVVKMMRVRKMRKTRGLPQLKLWKVWIDKGVYDLPLAAGSASFTFCWDVHVERYDGWTNLAGQFYSAEAGIGCVGRLPRGSEEREQKYRSHITRLLWIEAFPSLSFGTHEIVFVLNEDDFGSPWKHVSLPPRLKSESVQYLPGPVYCSLSASLSFPCEFYFRSRTTKILPTVRISESLFSPVVCLGLSEWPIAHGLCSLFVPIAKDESHHSSDILSEEWPRAVSGSAHMWGMNRSCMRSHSSLPLRKWIWLLPGLIAHKQGFIPMQWAFMSTQHWFRRWLGAADRTALLFSSSTC